MRIATVTPRGGAVGTSVVITGSGFGVTAGRVVFDPLGENGPVITAAHTLWQDDRVEFPVPAGVAPDKFTTLLVEKVGAADGADVPFWVPAAIPVTSDYQYPVYEDGAYRDVDDPRTNTAADFNRLLDRVLASVGDMLRAVYDTNDDGIVDVSAALDDAGTPRTWADVVSLVGAVPEFEPKTVTAPGQTVFSVASAVDTSKLFLFVVDGVAYTRPSHVSASGTTVTWLDAEFQLGTSDRVEILYYPT